MILNRQLHETSRPRFASLAKEPDNPKLEALSRDGYKTTSEVSRSTGVTLRQLQWWDERGVVSPMQVGHSRLYSPTDQRTVALVVQLRTVGFSLQKVRAVLRKLNKWLVLERATNDALLTDGKRFESMPLEKVGERMCALQQLW